MSNAVQDYLKYVKDVLGVSQVIQPRSADQPEQELGPWAQTRTGHWPEAHEVDLLIVHAGEGVLFHGESAELWEKMKGAMQLGSRPVLEVETSRDDYDGVILHVLESYPAAVTLLLSATPSRSPDFRALGSSKVLESFSPALLVQSPDLKRAAWGDLQAVMKSFTPAAATPRKN